MPTISMFFGIIVRMMFMDTQQHNLPHLHVKAIEPLFQFLMRTYCKALYPLKNCVWFKHGSPSMKKS